MNTDKLVIFSDMDGTFLDHNTYSYSKALLAIKKIRKKKVPLIFCSSRVRKEIEAYYKKLKMSYPFISENGAAIFIPKKFFSFNFKHDFLDGKYKVLLFGTKYKKLIEVLKKIRKQTGYKIKGFADLTQFELAKNAGISIAKAKIAKQREFSEPFILIKGDIGKIKKLIEKNGLKYTKGGRYHYIMGKNDKGKAVKKLSKMFKKEFGKIFSIGIGDGFNDLPMLLNVNKGFQVKNFTEKYSFFNKKVFRTKGIGPTGFKEAVLKSL